MASQAITADADLESLPETGLREGNHAPGAARVCDTTGLTVCLNAQLFIRLNAVMAVVSLLVGGIAALLVALTRWPSVHLLDAEWFYRILTAHGLNMLIFWIIFMEVAILYFAGTVPLKAKLASKGLAWVSFLLMTAGMILVNVMILTGEGDVL
ncbi:MAG: cbb3-type cytochrome c oxidase subunit I, partial [Myxococcales bacterium]|nr:cbb3-type cytochrome c oxidase subunit I [Myxococcales bacterium]